jgi:hypothetical protein
MDAKKKKLEIFNNKGQAIFEFLAFVPFLLGMLMVYLKVGSAINGSINQQKATRRFFYHLEKGNAFTPTGNLLFNQDFKSKQAVSYSAVGWNEELKNGSSPIAPCYPMPKFFSETDEKCEEPKRGETKTLFIKVYTVYGVCGTNFVKNGNLWAHDWANSSRAGSCFISE